MQRIGAAYTVFILLWISQVAWSLCVTRVSCAKTAKLIEMPFGWSTRVGPGNIVLYGGPDPPPREGALLKGDMRRPIATYLRMTACSEG